MLKQRLGGKAGHHHFHLLGKGHHDHDIGHEHNHDNSHVHHHDHAHETHTHDHGQHGPEHEQLDHIHKHQQVPGHPHAPQSSKSFSTWNLLLLGISGGLVPCPAAIATLLAAIGAGRIAQGLTMALFFSLGLGLVMMTIGVVLSQTGRFIENLGSNQEFSRRMSIMSAFIISVLGLVTLYHSIVSLTAT